MPEALQSLGSFTVTASFERHKTIFEVWPPRQPEPTARLYKDGPLLSRQPFQLLTGLANGEPSGIVTRRGAWTADGTAVGAVLDGAVVLDRLQGLTPGPKLPRWRWRMEQDGLPVLTGRPAGLAARARFNRVTDFLLQPPLDTSFLSFGDYVLPFRFRFRAGSLAGFDISRRTGQARLHVTVHDPRIDRRLVLACVVSISSTHESTIRQTAVNITTNHGRGWPVRR